jgi:hypothetical protein
MGKSGAATQLKRKETNTLETTSDLSRRCWQGYLPTTSS